MQGVTSDKVIKGLKKVLFAVSLFACGFCSFFSGYFLGVAITLNDFADQIVNFAKDISRATLEFAGVPFSDQISEEIGNYVMRELAEAGIYKEINSYYMASSIFSGIAFLTFAIAILLRK